MPKIILLGLLLVFASCNREQTHVKMEQNVFFSLKDYMSGEADRLNQQQTSLNKTITINDKTEQREVNEIDYHQELSLFSKADINKPAWSDKYLADTVFFAGRIPKSIHYKAKETELKTQEIHLYFQENKILDSLQIRSKSETALARNENWLQFATAKGYHIITEQNNFSGDSTRVEITSVFISNK